MNYMGCIIVVKCLHFLVLCKLPTVKINTYTVHSVSTWFKWVWKKESMIDKVMTCFVPKVHVHVHWTIRIKATVYMSWCNFSVVESPHIFHMGGELKLPVWLIYKVLMVSHSFKFCTRLQGGSVCRAYYGCNKHHLGNCTQYLLLHDGCHVSGWWADILRQIFFPTSNRPFG